MKTYISYVIQDDTGHKHHAEIISFPGPPYLPTPEWQAEAVSEWIEKKLAEIKFGQELVVTGVFSLTEKVIQ